MKTTRSYVHALRNVVLVRICRFKYVVWLHSQAISKPLSMSRRSRTVFLIRVRSLPRTLSRRSSQAVSVKIYDSSTGSELAPCFVSPGEGKIQRILKIVSVKKTTKKRKPWLQVITCAAPLSTASTYGVGNIHVVNYPTMAPNVSLWPLSMAVQLLALMPNILLGMTFIPGRHLPRLSFWN